MAKKKKPAANPARGFATTSVASKPKEPVSSEAPGTADVSGVATPVEAVTAVVEAEAPESADSSSAHAQRELHELSPAELEAQLEASELQQFVEKYAAKIKKETTRQVTRLQTDKRLLRGQAEFLSVREWLPDELMLQVFDLALSDRARDSDPQSKSKSPVGDDLIAKVWQLRQCLLDLTIPLARVHDVLAWIVANLPANISSSTTVWGLEECFDWLAFHCDAAELDEYDAVAKPTASTAIADLSDDEPETPVANNGKSPNKKRDSPLSTSDTEELLGISDYDSDLEPEEMLATHLRTTLKLYEINPAACEPQKGRSGRGSKPSAKASANGPVERKLKQKLRKIESDLLFDQREADEQWAVRKVELVREAAERRKLQLPDNRSPSPDKSRAKAVDRSGVGSEAERMGQELLEEYAEAEDGDLLSGMFDALPGVAPEPSGGTSASHADVTIRDFGKMTGMSPKRVLEEACKARDSRCRLAYKQVSQTTYACRHALTINWSKEQEPFPSNFLPAVDVKQKPNRTTVSMIAAAAPDVAQSEAYVAATALFLVFSGSPKEEKAHLRLPPTFRDLWDEFTALKQSYLHGHDAAIVKEVRKLVEKHGQADDDDDDEVIFNANLRRRNDALSRTSTPVSGADSLKAIPQAVSEELQQMWHRKVSTPSYQRMLVGRMNLPMFAFRDVALDTIRRHQVTILCGETGCGKSTQLPAFILENELAAGRPCKIYCTEPRRISAISLAQRVSEEMGEHKGDVGTHRSLVGYAIRLESQTTAQTRLVYATVGIVLRMLESANGINDITHLVLDEVHERSIDTDFLLIILRSLMLKRPDLKVVLMSATVDAQRFSNYLVGAPIIDVPGRTFPVQAKFLEDAIELTGHTIADAQSNAVDEDDGRDDDQEKTTAAVLQGYSPRTRAVVDAYDEYRIDYSLIVKLVDKIAHRAEYEPFSKAILIFLPGIAEIRQLNDMLCGHPKFLKGWQVYPLHSTFSSEDQQAAFDIPPPGIRKIVLATNIAETGITIPDVTCVIDTGKHKEMRFDERRQMSRLIQSFIARANAKQRRGRAGRVQEGLCFHLFTKHRHDTLMVEQQTPEMLRLSLQDLVMRVKICKLGQIEQALSEALDPPSSKNVRRAIDALVEVGALTSNEELTPLGTQLAKLPLDAQLGKLILLGSNFGCLDFTLTAAAALSSKSPFLNPMHAKKQADTVRLGFKRGDSDLLTVYSAYSAWRKVCTTQGMSEYQFCNKNFLSPQNLGNIEDLKGQLLSSLVDAGFVHLRPDERTALSRLRHNSRHRAFVALPAQYTKANDNDALANSVVAWSFYPKLLKRDGAGWRNIANNQSLGLHPTSVNKTSLPGDVRLLSFYSIMQSSSRFTNAQETSATAEFALVLMAGEAVFYMFAGVIVLDGNRLRVKVRDWRTMVVLKTLRGKMREVVGKLVKNPGRGLGDRPRRWMEVVERVFERQRRDVPSTTLVGR